MAIQDEEVTEAPESTQIGLVFGALLGVVIALIPVADIVSISMKFVRKGTGVLKKTKSTK